jgi:hypothetical protein
MKRAAIGIRVHSGWGALVAVCGSGEVDVVERCRVEIIRRGSPGAFQPYHYAEKMNLSQAELHIAGCALESSRLANERLRDILARLNDRGFEIAGAAILLSSGRPLPDLAHILAAHALIHSAEGEFFRRAFRTALDQLQLPVTGIRERELEEQAHLVFEKNAGPLRDRINSLGRSLGPPWTQDQKTAALAAAIILAAPGSRRAAAHLARS